MSFRRSKSVIALIVGVAAVSSTVIVAGVIYRGAVDAEHARVSHVQAVSENRWERQAASVLHTTVKSTMKALDQPITEAQAIYDSTAGRASEEAREALKNAIAAARNAPPTTLARADSLTDAKDLSVASEGAIKLVSTLKGDLLAALKVPQEQAVALDAAAEAKRKAAEAIAVKKKAVPGSTSPRSPATSPPAITAASPEGTTASAVCLGGGTGYEGAIACVKALAHGMTVTVEWGWSSGGYTTWNPGTMTATVKLEDSMGSNFGITPGATSLVMHEAGHASSARCPAISDDPVFDKPISYEHISNVNNKAERFATSFAIAHGAPDHQSAGEWAYGFTATDEEIAMAGRC
jgi:hypothetical protein